MRFTVHFRNPTNGIVGGGDLDPSDPDNARTATSGDGGQTWTLTNAPPVTGAIFGLSYVRQLGSSCNKTCSAVAFASPDAGWLVGAGGIILKISF